MKQVRKIYDKVHMQIKMYAKLSYFKRSSYKSTFLFYTKNITSPIVHCKTND
ncbi:MAG: hypothetical protein ACI87N_002083 [Flavobacteriales bacterium]|jgi:hypothetical protein